MTESQVLQELCDAIRACQTASGRIMPKLSRDDRPHLAVPGFDSLCGIEVTVDMEERLGLELADENMFVKDVRGRKVARTLNETLCTVLEALRRGGKNGAN